MCIPAMFSLATLMVSCWFPRKLRPKSSHARWRRRVAKSWYEGRLKKEAVRLKHSRSMELCEEDGDTDF